MSEYEIMYILKANLDEANRNAEIEKVSTLVTDNGGKVNNTDLSMGLRDLAYPIKDELKGFYVVIKVSADDQTLSEFNRKIRHYPNVLRHLVVRKNK